MPTRQLLTVAAAALVLRALHEHGGVVRLASLVLHRRRAGAPEESRLYSHRRRRLEAHLARRRDGGRAVLVLPVGGAGRSAVYAVDEASPWSDFERQAGLRHAAWGPCRDASAGL